jgi:hypothetical protein
VAYSFSFIGSEIKQSVCPQLVRKSAAKVVDLCLLGCRMLHLEHRLDQEAFRIVLVSTKRQHFAEDAACGAS